MIAGGIALHNDRHELILDRARTERMVRVKSLAEGFGVHEMTIRRDLDLLCDLGLLERTHGGARLVQQVGRETTYAIRAGQQVGAKQRISQAARQLIRPGDTVALDASTTVLALAQGLSGHDITAVVTGLDAANALAAQDIPFLLTGGSFHAKARSLTGAWVAASLSRIRVDRVFFSSKGLSHGSGFCDAHPAEAEAKQSLIKAGRQVVALIDSSKFDQEALCQIATLKEVNVLITDQQPPSDLALALEAAGVEMIIAE